MPATGLPANKTPTTGAGAYPAIYLALWCVLAVILFGGFGCAARQLKSPVPAIVEPLAEARTHTAEAIQHLDLADAAQSVAAAKPAIAAARADVVQAKQKIEEGIGAAHDAGEQFLEQQRREQFWREKYKQYQDDWLGPRSKRYLRAFLAMGVAYLVVMVGLRVFGAAGGSIWHGAAVRVARIMLDLLTGGISYVFRWADRKWHSRQPAKK